MIVLYFQTDLSQRKKMHKENNSLFLNLFLLKRAYLFCQEHYFFIPTDGDSNRTVIRGQFGLFYMLVWYILSGELTRKGIKWNQIFKNSMFNNYEDKIKWRKNKPCLMDRTLNRQMWLCKKILIDFCDSLGKAHAVFPISWNKGSSFYKL